MSAVTGLTAAGTVLDEDEDADFAPDVVLTGGEMIEGDGWRVEAMFTPGHASNHMAFVLREENALFSGDHVMGWSTTVVAPPDGNMRQYMASLDAVITHDFDSHSYLIFILIIGGFHKWNRAHFCLFIIEIILLGDFIITNNSHLSCMLSIFPLIESWNRFRISSNGMRCMMGSKKPSTIRCSASPRDNPLL